LHLRLRGDESRLPAYERAVLAKLFPKGREITSTELQQVYATEGFDPEAVLDVALNQREENEPGHAAARPSWFWKMILMLVPLLLVVGFGLMLSEAFRSQYINSIEATFYLGGGVIAAVILAWNLPVTLGGLSVALAMLVPVLAAVPGLIALHFFHTLPLLPDGSAGLALLALGGIAGVLLMARMRSESLTPERRLASRAESFVRRELRRARPNLDDTWLPQIIALGCASAVEKWRARRTHDTAAPRFEPGAELSRPFTGNVPRPEEQWACALEVPSAEDRRELEEEEDEERGSKNPPAG
jgi:hypothetical protein